jgi:uncharacterized protein (DUF302 family)
MNQTLGASAAQSDSPRYGITREVALSYEEAVARIRETLKEQGFGILTEIDVKQTLKTKLDKDFTQYIILGACNPPLAYRALSTELDIGLLLPCNVDVYEHPESGRTVISAVNPEVLVQVTGRQELAPIAEEVRAKLTAAIQAV